MNLTLLESDRNPKKLGKNPVTSQWTLIRNLQVQKKEHKNQIATKLDSIVYWRPKKLGKTLRNAVIHKSSFLFETLEKN